MENKRIIKIITAVFFIPLLLASSIPASNSTNINLNGGSLAYAENSSHYNKILKDVQKQIKKGKITFSHKNDRNGLLYNEGYIKRKDGALIKTNIRVLKTLRILTKYEGYTINVLDILGTHSRHTTSGNVSAHWGGRAFDISAINGKKLKYGGEKETREVMKILNGFQKKYPHLKPKQLICEGNGKKDRSVAKYSMTRYQTTDASFSYRVGGHQDHIHIGW